MKTKIENQEQYEARIEYFKKKYIKDFQKKVSTPDCDMAYVRERFKRDILEPRMNEILNTENINEPHHFRNQKKWVNGIKTFEAIKQFCEERKPKKDFQLILQALAEYDAISDYYNEIVLLEKGLTENVKQIETLDEFISRIQNDKNVFCQVMPLEIPIEHFKVFVERKNKSGNTYLTNEQFISFIKRAFLNDKSIDKITLTIGNGERGFVVKRFYEFFTIAANEYEKTNQCKDKYLRFVTENFNNWSYEKLKNNFTNKTKRSW
ncbi:MAG TPA: hypothetical protein VIL78_10195 [Hanamia sp.]